MSEEEQVQETEYQVDVDEIENASVPTDVDKGGSMRKGSVLFIGIFMAIVCAVSLFVYFIFAAIGSSESAGSLNDQARSSSPFIDGVRSSSSVEHLRVQVNPPSTTFLAHESSSSSRQSFSSSSSTSSSLDSTSFIPNSRQSIVSVFHGDIGLSETSSSLHDACPESTSSSGDSTVKDASKRASTQSDNNGSTVTCYESNSESSQGTTEMLLDSVEGNEQSETSSGGTESSFSEINGLPVLANRQESSCECEQRKDADEVALREEHVFYEEISEELMVMSGEQRNGTIPLYELLCWMWQKYHAINYTDFPKSALDLISKYVKEDATADHLTNHQLMWLHHQAVLERSWNLLNFSLQMGFVLLDSKSTNRVSYAHLCELIFTLHWFAPEQLKEEMVERSMKLAEKMYPDDVDNLRVLLKDAAASEYLYKNNSELETVLSKAMSKKSTPSLLDISEELGRTASWLSWRSAVSFCSVHYKAFLIITHPLIHQSVLDAWIQVKVENSLQMTEFYDMLELILLDIFKPCYTIEHLTRMHAGLSSMMGDKEKMSFADEQTAKEIRMTWRFSNHEKRAIYTQLREAVGYLPDLRG